MVDILKDYRDNRFSIDHGNEGHGGRPTSAESQAYRAWLGHYADTLGSPNPSSDTLPVPIFLPPFGTKKDVLDKYVHEMTALSQPAIDVQYAYQLWREGVFPRDYSVLNKVLKV